MLLIGVAGKKGVGKNFVADRIREYAERRGLKIEMAAFADPLKEFCINVLGVPRQAAFGSDVDKNVATRYNWEQMPEFVKSRHRNKSGHMTVRETLQVFGTEFIRDCWDKEAWVSAMERRILGSKADIFVITDMRFPNEADLVTRLGGQCWMIVGAQRGDESKKNDSHESETAMAGIEATATILNAPTDTPDTMREKVAMEIEAPGACLHCDGHKPSIFITIANIALAAGLLAVGGYAMNGLNMMTSTVLWGMAIITCFYGAYRCLRGAWEKVRS